MLVDMGVLGSQMGGPALRSSRMFIVETFYGDLAIAEAELRAACAHLEEIGESWAATTAYAELALVLCDQGRFEEAATSADDHRRRQPKTTRSAKPAGERRLAAPMPTLGVSRRPRSSPRRRSRSCSRPSTSWSGQTHSVRWRTCSTSREIRSGGRGGRAGAPGLPEERTDRSGAPSETARIDA